MSFLSRVFVIGSLSALGAVVIDRARQRRAAQLPRTPERRPLERKRGPGPELDIEDAMIIAETSGLSNVDPQPLTHTAGEGIVPDEDVRARSADQRGRLPRTR